MAILALDGAVDFSSLDFSFLNFFDDWAFRDNARFRIAANPLLGLTKPYSFEDVEAFVGGPAASPDWAASLLGKGLKLDANGFATAGRLTGFLSYDYTSGFSALIVDINLSYVEFEAVYMSVTLEDDALLFDKLLAGHDRITCGSGDDLVWGHTGNDSIFGNDGADSIWGDAGNDKIYGGANNDELVGNLGHDTVFGGAGDDDIYGEDGNDVIHGEAGDDTLSGWLGNDKLYGGTGDDAAFGGAGKDKVYGDAGADSVCGDEGNDSLYGGADSDSLFGGDNNDLIYGDAGNDLLLGENGNDSLYGGAGADTLNGGLGTDVLAGGSDTLRDVFVFAFATESGMGPGRDLVANFKSGTDKLDFADFDADSVTAGDQSLAFNGSVAAAHKLWTVDIGADLLLRGDVTGDGVADFEIQIKAINSLQVTDFIF